MYPFNTVYGDFDSADIKGVTDFNAYTRSVYEGGTNARPSPQQVADSARAMEHTSPSGRPINPLRQISPRPQEWLDPTPVLPSNAGSDTTYPGYNSQGNTRPSRFPCGHCPKRYWRCGSNRPCWVNGNRPDASNANRAPSSPPPDESPIRGRTTRAVDPRSLCGCLYHYTYVWLRSNVDFWFYPVYIGQRSVAGYCWTRCGWVYVGLDLHQIDFFQCR
ncbi:MAG: hypothetical protein LBL96_12495 [Clostridiales bacterium]|nr:hypothetical protein [Clostridiales bacterium]